MVKSNMSREFLRKVKDKIIVFHYSCSSLEKNVIKISSIAVYDSSEEIIYNFSRNDQEDNSEIDLLAAFFKYMKKRYDEGFYFLGFNNKKPHYGFEVLKKRYSKLTKKRVFSLPNNRTYDLDQVLKKYYPNYFGGLHILADANKIRLNNFVMGIDEIKLFEKNQFQKLNLSTYSKVNIIYKLFKLYLANNLKVTNDGDIVYSLEDSNYYFRFKENIKKIKDMIKIKEFYIHNPDHEQFLRNLLYINVITSMETYLSDAFIYNVKVNEKFLKKFVQSYKSKEFNGRINLPEIIEKYKDITNTTIKDFLTSECLDELKKITFHRLDLVKELYSSTYGVVFLSDLKAIFIGIKNRHGLVHRNGKDENGSPIIIKVDDLKKLIQNIEKFILDIDTKLKKSIISS